MPKVPMDTLAFRRISVLPRERATRSSSRFAIILDSSLSPRIFLEVELKTFHVSREYVALAENLIPEPAEDHIEVIGDIRDKEERPDPTLDRPEEIHDSISLLSPEDRERSTEYPSA